MREIVNLFSERESRDELGIGQVRDALSDTLLGPADLCRSGFRASSDSVTTLWDASRGVRTLDRFADL